MAQCIAGPLTRQLMVYRQRVAAAPALLECETLSRAHVTQLWQATQVKGRQRLFPPYVTFSPPYTFFLLKGDMELYRNRHLFI
jgi:hypothetical protein